MKTKILIATILLSSLYGCTFPRPKPATTEMNIDVNNSEWATMSNRQKEMEISDFDAVDNE